MKEGPAGRPRFWIVWQLFDGHGVELNGACVRRLIEKKDPIWRTGLKTRHYTVAARNRGVWVDRSGECTGGEHGNAGAGYPVRGEEPSQDAWICGDRYPYTGAGNWGVHGDFQRDGKRSYGALPLPGCAALLFGIHP